MKTIQIADDIVPLADFKAHASQLFRRLREDQRPLVITQNGKPAGVLITPEEFDRIRERESFVAAVREGLADSAAGRLIDDGDLDAELDAEFGTLE
ncbi:MAG TPA: type II toxin-antitoxin system Phd/YefM family antitoxin [Thermoanaerobaculia bacterium]|jgi:prevent-host-death family protein